MDNVACSGDELNIGQCRHRGFNIHNCNHDEDAGVVCSCKCKLCGQRLLNTTEWGNADASSEWSEEYSSGRAFQQWIAGDKPWISKKLPATVWYRFDKKITLAKISFNSECRPNGDGYEQLGLPPETFDVVASDDCHNWMVLRTVDAAGFTGSGQTKSWEIPCENQGEYYCYGIHTTRVITQGVRAVGVAITNIKMYSLIWTPL